MGHRLPEAHSARKAQEVKKTGVSLADRVLGNPDLVGTLGSWTAPLANWANENRVHRALMQGVLGIHKEKTLPPFAWKTFAARFRSHHTHPAGEPIAQVAFFSTCFVNYNAPGLGMDTLEVMARNNVEVAFAYEQCCGMPAWHNGDMDGAIASAKKNVTALARHVAEACSGHDGTWAMKKEHFPDSLKWGGRAFKEITAAAPETTCSDCPLAAIQIEQGTGRRTLNPIEILARSYRGEQIKEADKP